MDDKFINLTADKVRTENELCERTRFIWCSPQHGQQYLEVISENLTGLQANTTGFTSVQAAERFLAILKECTGDDSFSELADATIRSGTRSLDPNVPTISEGATLISSQGYSFTCHIEALFQISADERSSCHQN